jgi:hypothetical protein
LLFSIFQYFLVYVEAKVPRQLRQCISLLISDDIEDIMGLVRFVNHLIATCRKDRFALFLKGACRKDNDFYLGAAGQLTDLSCGYPE